MTLASPKITLFGLTGAILFIGVQLASPVPQTKGSSKNTKSNGQVKKSNLATQASLSGEQLFAKKCAKCHGDKGQGGAAFPKPLVGTQSVSELARFIGNQMPPGPVKTPAGEAKKVAEFMHGAFYSPVAQDRNRPAKIELQRLTVRQIRNALADLVDGDRDFVPYQQGGGLEARYWNERLWKGEPQIQRVDRSIDFDFGTGTPTAEGPDSAKAKFDPYNFAILWSGSIVPPDTGEYEFIVRTEHAARMHLNNDKAPVVDAWVRSGNDNEFRGSAYLMAGRPYPIRLEFSKAVVGVADQDKRKEKPSPPASIQLLWKRPKLAPEVIPARSLSPRWSPQSYAVSSPFPADDRSIGYERGNSISKEWHEAVTNAALDTANYVVANAKQTIGTELTAGDARAKAIEFAARFATRAFRSPLTPEMRALYVEKHFAPELPVEEGLKRSLVLTIKSPRFFLRETRGTDAFATASHLAFSIWDTIPDEALLQAAAKGQLISPAQIEAQASRMIQHPKADQKLKSFLLGWLKVDEVPDIVKDTKKYPGFDDRVATDLRTSLELYLDETVLSEKGSYQELFTSRKYPVNSRLGRVYGAAVRDAEFKSLTLDEGQRAGVLMHPYMLSRYAYLEASSPIHRGVLIARSMLGRVLQPPPAAFAPVAASLHPKLTTRQRVAMQTKPAACDSCHSMINPLGFSLERFDAIGKIRTEENGQKVDTTGFYQTRSGTIVKFGGAGDLSRFLATSEEAQSAFTEKLFHHVAKQPALAYRPTMVKELRDSFESESFNVRKLVARIAVDTVPGKLVAEKTPTADPTSTKSSQAKGASKP